MTTCVACDEDTGYMCASCRLNVCNRCVEFCMDCQEPFCGDDGCIDNLTGLCRICQPFEEEEE